ncbi:MAG TPA: TetR family transcriptional regulator [Marmoricola sp.]|nr:TetR family transcriptional regulator [Marmoricola sp.]
MNKPVRRGRRAGAPDTRELIRDAARARFLAEGYQAVTLRDVAGDAGVDVALISYYFGSKQGLFGAAMALPVNPATVVVAELEDPDVDTLAERMLRNVLTVWGDPATGPQLQALAAMAVTDPRMNELVREAVGNEITQRIAVRIGGADAEQRAGAFTAQMAGLIFTRYVLRLEPIASMVPDDVVRQLRPALQASLGG